MIRRLAAFALTLAVAYGLAAIAATQAVLARLTAMGLPVTLGQRVAATAHDLAGMASSYLPIIAAGLAVAFTVAALLGRLLPAWRLGLYVAAGFSSIVAANLILHAVFDITPIAAARTWPGLLLQGLAGAAGGYVFVRALPDRIKSTNQ